MNKLIYLFLLLNIIACTDGEVKITGDENPPIKKDQFDVSDPVEESLTATIDGNAWDFSVGSVKASPFGEDLYTISFFDSSVENPCQDFIMTDRRIIMITKLIEGKVSFNNEINATISFMKDDNTTSENYIATEGTLVLSEISDSTVKGKIVGRYDENNKFNGSFELTRCD